MKKGLNLKMMTMGLALCSMVACTGNTANKTADATECPEQCTCDNTKNNKEMKYSKKYTNGRLLQRRQIRSESSYRSYERHV